LRNKYAPPETRPSVAGLWSKRAVKSMPAMAGYGRDPSHGKVKRTAIPITTVDITVGINAL